jgi:hypothetical protein
MDLMKEAYQNMQREHKGRAPSSAMEEAGQSSSMHLSPAEEHQQVTLSYNMARLREAMGDYREAKRVYKVI